MQTGRAEGGNKTVFLNEVARVHDQDVRTDIRALILAVDRLATSVSPVGSSNNHRSSRMMSSPKPPQDSILQLPHDEIDSIADDVRRLKAEMDMQRGDNIKLTQSLRKLTQSQSTLRRQNGSLQKRVRYLQYESERKFCRHSCLASPY